MEVQLQGFVLSREDLKDLWPEATDDQIQDVATVLTDYLMEQWYSNLFEAVRFVKEEYGKSSKN